MYTVVSNRQSCGSRRQITFISTIFFCHSIIKILKKNKKLLPVMPK